MRFYKSNNVFSVHAIAGTYIVLLCMNMEKEQCENLLGFAIKCKDHLTGEEYWLRGTKTFKSKLPYPQAGSLQDPLEYPIQAFLWGDYTAYPNRNYTYTIYPIRGPFPVKKDVGLEIEVKTQKTYTDTHSVFFNRGNTASQAFARKFGDQSLKGINKDEMLEWLTRGLYPAMSHFIRRANDTTKGLRAAFYEFNYYPILDDFKKAYTNTGKNVHIIYDAKVDTKTSLDKETTRITKAAIKKKQLPAAMFTERKQYPNYISHNKFIILLENNIPTEVWTGSTNISMSALYGQANVGHIVKDKAIAEDYLKYWTKLKEDLEENKTFIKYNYDNFPFPKTLDMIPNNTMKAVFSPCKVMPATKPVIDSLDWYCKMMHDAKESAFFTAAFGVHDRLEEIYKIDKPYLRYILLEKADEDMAMLRRDKDTKIAIASKLKETKFGHWIKEKTLFGVHVKYIHTKFMLIDPLSDEPTIITGSGNFSEKASRYNDENMLIIRGDKEVTDIYLTEFMRLFNHYYSREIFNRQNTVTDDTKYKSLTKTEKDTQDSFVYLKETDEWAKKYFEKDSQKEKERILFGKDSR